MFQLIQKYLLYKKKTVSIFITMNRVFLVEIKNLMEAFQYYVAKARIFSSIQSTYFEILT